MKNIIMFYYNLTPKNIHQNNHQCWFFIDKEKYLFVQVNESIDSINEKYYLSKELHKFDIPIHEIILNKDQKIITIVENKNFILMKTKVKNDILSFLDIESFSKKTNMLITYLNVKRKISWKSLWISKVDYFEYQISQFGMKFPLVKECFDYFIGLTENAISYTNEIHTNNICISHKRIYENMNLEDFYNPLELIVDYKVRDIVEYIKFKLFYGYISFAEVEYYLEYCISNEDYITFYTRLLFPTPFFDLYEDIILKNKDEDELKVIIEHINDYEKLLKKTYQYISKKTYIPPIDWLNKISIDNTD